jgi:hypothetical protein
MPSTDTPDTTQWRDLVGLLTDAGLPLRRQPPPPRHSMESHRADWLAAGRLPDGGRVWIRVLHYASTIRSRWQITAYRTHPTQPRPFGPSESDQHRLLLHDPTPAEALATAVILGLASGSTSSTAHPRRPLEPRTSAEAG